jgi:hypothetical protein
MQSSSAVRLPSNANVGTDAASEVERVATIDPKVSGAGLVALEPDPRACEAIERVRSAAITQMPDRLAIAYGQAPSPFTHVVNAATNASCDSGGSVRLPPGCQPHSTIGSLVA